MNLIQTLIDCMEADSVLGSALGGKIFGATIPLDEVPSLVKVTLPQTVLMARPTTAWFSAIAVVDFHALNYNDSLLWAERLARIAPTFVGVHDTCVITDCQMESIQPVTDEGWTPVRYRQVVTVDVTAREP